MGDPIDELDAMRAAPDHHAILLDTDRVRVLDTRLRPGERTPIHTHCWPAALYVLSWSDIVRRDATGAVIADSRVTAASRVPGEASWLEPLPPHSVENVGDRDLHIIAIELKSVTGP